MEEGESGDPGSCPGFITNCINLGPVLHSSVASISSSVKMKG